MSGYDMNAVKLKLPEFLQQACLEQEGLALRIWVRTDAADSAPVGYIPSSTRAGH